MVLSVVVVGAGPIGLGVAREIVARPRTLKLAAVVDTDPAKVGTTVEGVPISAALPADAQVAALTTTSSLARLEPLCVDVVARGMHVVSTCEQLAWPWTASRRAVAERIDAAAKRAGVAVLGTGVNPGFVMDALPLALTAPCRRVERVRVERVQDASTRRRPFQDKVGVGMEPADVDARLRSRQMGHVGLEESARMLAARLALGVADDDAGFTEDFSVVVAERDVSAHGRRVEAGRVLGVEQIGRARDASGRVVVELYFRATFGQADARDRVLIDGEPKLDVTLAGGVPGDVATCAIVANAIPVVVEARPGLRTMADVPVVVATR